jgi:hypothetical protein
MVATLQAVLEGVIDRLHYHIITYTPAVVAALIIVLGAYITALFLRWLLNRIFKGLAIDKFLRQSGVAYMIDSSGRLRATRLVSETVYWAILLTGILMGISVFGTALTDQIIQGFIYLLPRLLVTALILLGGAWLSQYLGRSTLVWGVNENIPHARRLALGVRIIIMFVAVVVAADQLAFARSVFLAAFIILVGGAVLAAALAVGIGAASGARRFFEPKPTPTESAERSLWNHL